MRIWRKWIAIRREATAGPMCDMVVCVFRHLLDCAWGATVHSMFGSSIVLANVF